VHAHKTLYFAPHLDKENHPMFDIFIKTHFSGAHHLRDYPGECELPHGHNWKIEVTVRAKEVDEIGMGIDFKILKKHVKEIVDKLDHRDLNAMEEFSILNPSSEHIAMFLFDNLEQVLQAERYHLHSVTVMETDNQGLTYYGKNVSQ
jgi:6-pyruvoyltetrahydropterin/6-carboxytetrahydropterin synthase